MYILVYSEKIIKINQCQKNKLMFIFHNCKKGLALRKGAMKISYQWSLCTSAPGGIQYEKPLTSTSCNC